MKRDHLGPHDAPDAATLFDPVAWERRVAEARLRRDRVLSRRDGAGSEETRALHCARIARAPLPRPPLPRVITADPAPPPGPRKSEAAEPEVREPETPPAFAAAETAAPRTRRRLVLPAAVVAILVAGWALIDSPAPDAPAPESTAAAPAAAPTLETALAPAFPPVKPDATVPLPPVAEAPRQHVRLLAPAGLAPGDAARAADLLREAGFYVSGPVTVPLSVAQTNVRYFHAADADNMAELGAVLAPLTGTEPGLRGFTDLADPPAPGTVEVWLAGPALGEAPAEAKTASTSGPLVEAATMRALVSFARNGE